MNIGFAILELEEEEERAAAALERRSGVRPQDLRALVAEVERQIAAITAQLDPEPGDDPALYPLRKKLVGLWNTRRDLLEQMGGA